MRVIINKEDGDWGQRWSPLVGTCRGRKLASNDKVVNLYLARFIFNAAMILSPVTC